MRTLAILLIPLLAASLAGGEEAAPVTISRVKTRQELEAQPEVGFRGHTVRFGLEDVDPRVAGGCLLYALMEGDAVAIGDAVGPRFLGPFTIRWRVGDHPPGRAVEKMKRLVPDLPPGLHVYAATLVFPRPGERMLELVAPDGTVVATASFDVKDEELHPWMPLGVPPEQAEAAPPVEGIDAAGAFSSTPRPAAVPDHQGLYPYRAATGPTAKVPNDMPLPSLIPQDGRLRLERDAKGRFVITSPEDIVLSHAHTRFLCRWWVKGEPFVPAVAPQLMATSLTGLVIEGRTLQLTCSFDPTHLGAESGDEIGLQLLYCREGWRYTEEGLEMLALQDEGGPEALLSNRLDFTAP